MSSIYWRRRVVFWAGAGLVAVAAVALALAADWAQAVHTHLTQGRGWMALILTPLAFAAIAWATRRWFPGAEGSGIPQAIATLELDDRATRRLLSLRVAIGKAVLMMAAFLGGASIGREGPTVQLGAALLLAVGGRARGISRGALVLAGSAAGVAAAFNTPVAGIVFVIEEMAQAFDRRTAGVVLSAVVVGGLASRVLLGDYSYLGVSEVALGRGLAGWLAAGLCGVVGGALGGVFARLTLALINRIPASGGGRLLLWAGGCGLVSAGVALACGGVTVGSGYEIARAAVEGGPVVAWWYAPAKLVATLAAAVGGIPGGIFAPSLSVGAGLGSALSALMPGVPAAVLAMLGMVAYFAGVTQAPITSFVIVMEMTSDHALMLPLMVAGGIGYAVGRLVGRHALYHALAERYTRAARAPEREAS